MTELCIVTCSNFRREVAAIVAQDGLKDVRLASFAATCIRPRMGRDPAETLVAACRRQGCAIAALGSYCLARVARAAMGGPWADAPDTCMELVADAATVEQLLNQGAYLLTPGWLSNWRRYMREWGFDRETACAFFAETVRVLTLLDTGVCRDSAAQLQALAEFLRLPWSSMPVGLDPLRCHVTALVQRLSRG